MKESKKTKLPCEDLIAVLYVESGFDIGAINEETSDYGIGQINSYNIKKLKLNKRKLLENIGYSVGASAKILAWFYQTYAHKEPKLWVVRYNCGTAPKCINWKSSKKYIKKISDARSKQEGSSVAYNL